MQKNQQRVVSHSPFSRLHQQKQGRVRHSKRTANTLLALSHSDHAAIAAVIKQWLNE
ncbi:hypothetical protein [Alteromonas oceanisediminis]|uniref:hypothetical protein n=1 Tax=Alteromonas oceanisediminis TaxID=2836180 RepID=UPI001BDA430A|nr:hypothetical protein [Alteromonas oceanisediminis]MBT0586567.1 hypothetical protein [Alteromonas oceanisediminis]